MHWSAEIKVVIFDLDGTLYQDDQFYKRYVTYLVEGTALENEVASVIELAEQILYGNHPVKIGCFYHALHDHFLKVENGQVRSVFTWEGKEFSSQACTMYTDNLDIEECFYLGDAWSLVSLLAVRYKLSSEQLQQAFIRVRSEMLTEPFAIERNLHLLQAVQSLTDFRKILITNTFAQSGIEFVNYLGIKQAFEQIIYGGQKPEGMYSLMRSILKEEHIKPSEIISIGDNAWNDLYPVRQLGGRTVWISAYESVDLERWDVHVSSLDELAYFLQLLGMETLQAHGK